MDELGPVNSQRIDLVEVRGGKECSKDLAIGAQAEVLDPCAWCEGMDDVHRERCVRSIRFGEQASG